MCVTKRVDLLAMEGHTITAKTHKANSLVYIVPQLVSLCVIGQSGWFDSVQWCVCNSASQWVCLYTAECVAAIAAQTAGQYAAVLSVDTFV